MNQLLKIIINDEMVLEYNKSNRLPGHQRQFLDQMDNDMDQGIELNGQVFNTPSQEQRAKYIAMYLINALLNETDHMVIASCAYLGHRLPDLEKVIAEEHSDEVTIEFTYC